MRVWWETVPGIGAATAAELAAEGAEVVLSGRRHDALQATCEQIAAKGGVASCLPLDVTRPEAFEEIASRIGDIDILVYTSVTNTPRSVS